MPSSSWEPFFPYSTKDVREFSAQGLGPVIVQQARLERAPQALFSVDLTLFHRTLRRRMVWQFITVSQDGPNINIQTTAPLHSLDQEWLAFTGNTIAQILSEVHADPNVSRFQTINAAFPVTSDVPPPLNGVGYRFELPGLIDNAQCVRIASYYLQVASSLPGARCLVIGAGCGYGAKLLALHGMRVDALESNDFLHMYSRETYSHVSIAHFHAAWPTELPNVTSDYDIVVVDRAFDELPFEEFDEKLAEIGDVLGRTGRLVFVGTALGVAHGFGRGVQSAMSRGELAALLKSRFDRVEMTAQPPQPGSADDLLVAECGDYNASDPLTLPSRETSRSANRMVRLSLEHHPNSLASADDLRALWRTDTWRYRMLPDSGLIELNGVSGFLVAGDVFNLFERAQRLPAGARIVEVGSFMGLSSTIIAHGLIAAGNATARLFCVDTWEGSIENQAMEVIRLGELFDRFEAHIRTAGAADFITPIRSRSVDAAVQFDDASLDMLFIDGDHSYEGCYSDLIAWYPKLKPGGALIGHDCEPGAGVERAVRQFASENSLEYSVFAPPQSHYAYELRPQVANSIQLSDATLRRAPITVIVHTRNEEPNIAACLESVKDWAAEIIVMDMESSDRTIEIARGYTNRIATHSYTKVVEPARNASAALATSDWILYLDADERMTRQLALRISAFLEAPPEGVVAVQLPYKNHFLGRWIQNAGGWYPGYKQPMLLKKGCFNQRPEVHGGVEVNGGVAQFPADDSECAIEHYSFTSLAQWFEKFNRYTDGEADKLAQAGGHTSWQMIAAGFAQGFHHYYEQTRGRSDGLQGFLLSLCAAVYEMTSQMKLAEKVCSTSADPSFALPGSAAEFLRYIASIADEQRLAS